MTIATPPSSSFLDDGLTLFAPTGGGLQNGFGKVAGVNRIIDTGSASVPWNGVAALELSVLRRDGDQTYLLIIEGSKVSNFASATQDLATFTPGAINPQDVLHLKNTFDDEVYRYLRLKWVVTGTNPEIKGLVFIKSISDLDQLSLGDSLTVFSLLATNSHNANTNFRTWMTGHAYGGPNADGKYPLSDGLGNTVLVACPAKWAADARSASPLFYGAIGDGFSHKAREFYDTLPELQEVHPHAVSLDQEVDFLGLQAAVNSGRHIACDKHHFVFYNRDGDPQLPLKVIAGESSANFDASIFDAKQQLPRFLTEADQIAKNHDFTDDGFWENASIYSPEQIIFATFGGGKATMIDTSPEGPFYQWGQRVTLSPGDWEVKMTVRATLGDSYALGNLNPPWCGFGFFSDGPGNGFNPWDTGIGIQPDVWKPEGYDEQTVTATFHVWENGSAYLTFTGGGYANYEVTSFTLTPVLLNCAIWMTRDGSPEHYPLGKHFDGFRLFGPGGPAHKESVGVYYTSFRQTDGNHSHIGNAAIENFGTGLKFGTGAYLIQFTDFHVARCWIGVDFPRGVRNAGENLRWIGGGIAACMHGLLNEGGAGISFFAASFDYFGSALEGSGISGGAQAVGMNNGNIDFFGCHFEQQPLATPGLRFMQNNFGSMTLHGGVIIITGDLSSGLEPLINNIYSTSQLTFIKTRLYNCADINGIVADGAGQVYGTWINNGNPNTGQLISENKFTDVLGDAGGFEDVQGMQWSTLIGVDHSDQGIGIDGGLWLWDGDIRQYGQWENQHIEVSISDDFARTGTKSLRIRKNDKYEGEASDLIFLVPIDQAGREVFSRMYFYTPGPQNEYEGPQVKFIGPKSPDITVSSDGRTATRTSMVSGDNTFCIAGEAITGRRYVEFTIKAIDKQDGNFRVGLISVDEPSPSQLGSWGSVAYFSPRYQEIATDDPLTPVRVPMGSEIRVADIVQGFFGPRRDWNVNYWVDDDVVGMAIDVPNRTVMFRLNNGEWSPKVGIGGLGGVTPAVALSQIGDQVTMNCGHAEFKFAPPVGYRPLEPRDSVEVAFDGEPGLYRRTFFVRVTGRDEFNRPIFGRQDMYKGELNWNLPLEGPYAWNVWAPQTTYQTPISTAAEGQGSGAPHWATHFAIVLGLSALPACSVYLDDLIVNVF